MSRFLDKLERETDKKYILYVLAIIAFLESIILPAPVDIFTFSLASVQPKKWIKFGFIATTWSILGAIAGYFIGYYLFSKFGQPLIDFYGYQDYFNQVLTLFHKNTFFVMFISAFTPIPYKIFTLAGGALNVPFLPFVMASILGRGLRYFFETYLASRFGKKFTMHILKKFNLYSVIFVIIIVTYYLLRKFYFS